MPSKQGHKTTHHGVSRSGSVSILDPVEDESTQETVSIGGATVSVPHSCGCDGTEHRYGALCVSPGGKFVLLPE